MLSYKKHIALFIFLLPFATVQSNQKEVATIRAKWLVLSKCSLRVDGSTNVNTFSCIVPEYPQADTLYCYHNPQKTIAVPMSGKLMLNVQQFDCHNAMMTSDLRKTLKWKEFPKLNIQFLSLSKFPNLQPQQEHIISTVNIELAGISKMFNVVFKFSKDGQGIINLIGSQAINFSDFNLSPPHKLGGMIKARDRLDVEFRLALKPVE